MVPRRGDGVHIFASSRFSTPSAHRFRFFGREERGFARVEPRQASCFLGHLSRDCERNWKLLAGCFEFEMEVETCALSIPVRLSPRRFACKSRARFAQMLPVWRNRLPNWRWGSKNVHLQRCAQVRSGASALFGPTLARVSPDRSSEQTFRFPTRRSRWLESAH